VQRQTSESPGCLKLTIQHSPRKRDGRGIGCRLYDPESALTALIIVPFDLNSGGVARNSYRYYLLTGHVRIGRLFVQVDFVYPPS